MAFSIAALLLGAATSLPASPRGETFRLPQPEPPPAPAPGPSRDRRATAGSPPIDARCADEGETCACTGTVWYGAARFADDLTKWATQQSPTGSTTGSTRCSNGVFGDPAPNVRKACYCDSATLRVTAGADYCSVDSDGCVTDGAGHHGNGEACTVEVLAAGTLSSVGTFATEPNYDYVTILGQRYQGTTGPSDVAVEAGSTFTWRSDFSVTNAGWTICLAGTVAEGHGPTVLFKKAVTADAGITSAIAFPITMEAVNALSPGADAVSMRVFGEGQLTGTSSFDDVMGWIAPRPRPTHVHSAAVADVTRFWAEFRQVVEMQLLRADGVMAKTLLKMPTIFKDHTLGMTAAEVEKDFPTKFPTMLVEQFLGSEDGIAFDDAVVPRVGSDFVNSQVMLARVIGWAVSVVAPTAFASKWHEGRARPEEVAWLVATDDARVAGVPDAVRAQIKGLGLASAAAFTAYGTGSPKHPSWPAMHSAASSASLYLAVLLDLTETQLEEAIALDCAVATFRTFAGVHYESDNMAGLAIGQGVIRRELPAFLQANYGSDPAAVAAKIERVIANNDWRTRASCYNYM